MLSRRAGDFRRGGEVEPPGDPATAATVPWFWCGSHPGPMKPNSGIC